jgi:lipopolysaccharide export system protein LptC
MIAAHCVGAATGCRSGQVKEVEEVLPELKLERVRFRVWSGAQLSARGKASRLTLRRDSTELTASDLSVELPRDGEPVLISAPAGEGVLSERLFTVHGGVTVTRRDDVARTASARYAPLEGGGARVTGEEPVVMEGPGYRLDGSGFTLAPDTGALDVRGPATLLAGLPEKSPSARGAGRSLP